MGVKLHVDLETLQLIQGPGQRSPVTSLRFKRGDAARLQVMFLVNGVTPGTIGDPRALEIQIGIKQRNQFDRSYLAHSAGWSMPSEGDDPPSYECAISFNTEELNSALGVESATGTELSEITLMGEITWREGTGDPTSTRTFLVIVENDVNRGTEGTPVKLPTPDDWLAARALPLPLIRTTAQGRPTSPVDPVASAVGQKCRTGDEPGPFEWDVWDGFVWAEVGGGGAGASETTESLLAKLAGSEPEPNKIGAEFLPSVPSSEFIPNKLTFLANSDELAWALSFRVGPLGSVEMKLGNGETVFPTEAYIGEGITIIDSSSFYHSGAYQYIREITLPSTLVELGYSSLYDCAVDFTIPPYLEVLGPYSCAFTDIRHAVLPSTLTSIGEYAFGGSSLRSVVVEEGVTSLGGYMFGLCGALSEVSLPNSLRAIPYNTFSQCFGLSSIELPDTIESIGAYAFWISGLSSFVLPPLVTELPRGIFSYCASLASVTLHNNLTSIGFYAFYACPFTGITLPNSLVELGEGAFNYCNNLASIIIPPLVDSIGSYAFGGCTGLASISCLPLVAPSLGDGVFDGVATMEIHVPVGASGYGASYGGLNVIYDL